MRLWYRSAPYHGSNDLMPVGAERDRAIRQLSVPYHGSNDLMRCWGKLRT